MSALVLLTLPSRSPSYKHTLAALRAAVRSLGLELDALLASVSRTFEFETPHFAPPSSGAQPADTAHTQPFEVAFRDHLRCSLAAKDSGMRDYQTLALVLDHFLKQRRQLKQIGFANCMAELNLLLAYERFLAATATVWTDFAAACIAAEAASEKGQRQLAKGLPTQAPVVFHWHEGAVALPVLAPAAAGAGPRFRVSGQLRLGRQTCFHTSLAMEHASTLLNVAALYSHLAARQVLWDGDGIRRSCRFLQLAAGALVLLRERCTDELAFLGSDLSPEALAIMVHLCMVQAHECLWQAIVVLAEAVGRDEKSGPAATSNPLEAPAAAASAPAPAQARASPSSQLQSASAAAGVAGETLSLDAILKDFAVEIENAVQNKNAEEPIASTLTSATLSKVAAFIADEYKFLLLGMGVSPTLITPAVIGAIPTMAHPFAPSAFTTGVYFKADAKSSGRGSPKKGLAAGGAGDDDFWLPGKESKQRGNFPKEWVYVFHAKREMFLAEAHHFKAKSLFQSAKHGQAVVHAAMAVSLATSAINRAQHEKACMMATCHGQWALILRDRIAPQQAVFDKENRTVYFDRVPAGTELYPPEKSCVLKPMTAQVGLIVAGKLAPDGVTPAALAPEAPSPAQVEEATLEKRPRRQRHAPTSADTNIHDKSDDSRAGGTGGADGETPLSLRLSSPLRSPGARLDAELLHFWKSARCVYDELRTLVLLLHAPELEHLLCGNCGAAFRCHLADLEEWSLATDTEALFPADLDLGTPAASCDAAKASTACYMVQCMLELFFSASSAAASLSLRVRGNAQAAQLVRWLSCVLSFVLANTRCLAEELERRVSGGDRLEGSEWTRLPRRSFLLAEPASVRLQRKAAVASPPTGAALSAHQLAQRVFEKEISGLAVDEELAARICELRKVVLGFM